MSSSVESPLGPIRRIVTTHGADGRAGVKSDGPLANVKKEAAFEGVSHVAWATDASPATDNNTDVDGAERRIPGLGLVPAGGTNFRYTDFAPGANVAMHRTASVDYNIILVGELVLIMEDGDERALKAGDIVVQRGTLHGWRNPSGDQWTRMLSVLIDAQPAVVDGKPLPDEWRGDVAMGDN